jgi:glycosyltransferase involved in cell wall biosynthesis
MKPSILFIVPAYYDELKAKGVESMIFERDEGGFFKKVITIHPFSNKTRVIVLNQTHEIHEIGFDLIPGSDRFRLLKYLQSPLHFFRVVWTVVRLCKASRIDMIRANDPFWMGFFALIASRFCDIPFCVSIHADYDKIMEVNPDITISKVFGSYQLAKRMSRIVFSRATLIMPISQWLAKKIAQWGAESEKIQLIRHGINLAPFNFHPKKNIRKFFGIDDSKKIVSVVARVAKDKYIYDVLKIARSLANRRDDFVIIIAGGGREENRIRTEVSLDDVLKKCIVVSGFQPRDICLDLGCAAEVSICLLAGFSLIEACASGRPVVAYDVEWQSELIENEVTGFLVSENDFAAAAEKVDWLFDNPIEAAVMGKNARARVFEQHSFENASATKIKCYEQILLKTN